MNLIPYYMTKRVLSATVCHKKGLDTICVDMNMKVGARVEGDCLVVEPLVSVYGSACDVHDKDGSHPHRSCGQLECSLRLRVMEVLGLDSDPVGFKSYGWKVSGSPSSVFAALDKRFRCQAHRLEDDVDGNWVVARVPLIRTGHVRSLQTLMFLRSVSTSNMWLLNQLYLFSYGVGLWCSKVGNRWGDMVTPQEVEGVTEILSRVNMVEAAP